MYPIVAIVVVLVAVSFDLATRRIPNILTATLAARNLVAGLQGEKPPASVNYDAAIANRGSTATDR